MQIANTLADSFTRAYKRQQKKRRADRFLRTANRRDSAANQTAQTIYRLQSKQPALAVQMLMQPLGWRQHRERALAALQTPADVSMQSDQEAGAPKLISAEEEAINRNLFASATALGLAATGMFVYLPLAWLSVPLTVYASIDILRDAADALVVERKARHSLLDATVIVGALASQYYLASALASLTYYTGCKLMALTEDNTRQTLLKIVGEQPRIVWRWLNGAEVETSFVDLQAGDIVVVNAGETLPVDGTIVEGLAAVDQHLLSGEARPVEKEPGSPVYAGTTLLAGRIQVRVEKAGADTVAAQIGKILLHTADYKSSLQASAEVISDQSVLPTLGLSALTLASLGPASAVAVIGSNYAEVLRVVAPLGMLNFLGQASQQGILIKDGRALELLNQVDTVVFDKTGTLTLEEPHVSAIYTWDGFDADELLALAAAAEQRQQHPLARAISKAARERNLPTPPIDDSRYEVGYGIKATIEKRVVHVGSLRFMTSAAIPIPAGVYEQQQTAHEQGTTLVYVAVNGGLVGAIELDATLRPEARQMVEQLQARQLKLYIISGDHHEPTRRLALALGIDNFVAEVLPAEKAAWVARLQAEGRTVCFVGDGINDAIALKQAHTSISLRGASTAAIDTAQIVLTDESLAQLDDAFALAQRFHVTMRNNYLTTFGPGLLCLGGIYFLNFQILSALICYNVSLVLGLSNALLPGLRPKNLPSS